ncbi:hypothetical protein HHI36_009718 [Cryptolaemus montrouzieri]|uniref:Uncharacterized protein n=1 Tax=Cryptolaemus montrouzieri TaxID=559131 RepID=A0ABD2MGT9_9CUCU
MIAKVTGKTEKPHLICTLKLRRMLVTLVKKGLRKRDSQMEQNEGDISSDEETADNFFSAIRKREKMRSSDEEELLLLLVLAQSTCTRQFWVHPINQEREQLGEYHSLMKTDFLHIFEARICGAVCSNETHDLTDHYELEMPY